MEPASRMKFSTNLKLSSYSLSVDQLSIQELPAILDGFLTDTVYSTSIPVQGRWVGWGGG